MAEGKKRLYKRETANKALYVSLQRAVNVNADVTEIPYLYHIKELSVFGSLINTLDRVHDVDLAIKTDMVPDDSPKRDLSQGDLVRELTAWACTYAAGRASYSTYSYFIPYEETVRYVKGGQGVISLHSYTDLESMKCPYVSLIHNGKLTPEGKAVLENHNADAFAKRIVNGGDN